MTAHEHMGAAELMLQQDAHKRAMRYGDELFRIKCGPDLLALGVFPNLKELTESFGMYHAVRRALGWGLMADPSVALVAVGDGHQPRTGATFAFRSRWTCYSVDPQAQPSVRFTSVGRNRVERIHVVPARVEDWTLPPGYSRAVIAAVHSHAPLQAAVRACLSAARVDVFAMPCCVGQELSRPPDFERVDPCISSPKRTVRAWLDYRDPAAATLESSDA